MSKMNGRWGLERGVTLVMLLVTIGMLGYVGYARYSRPKVVRTEPPLPRDAVPLEPGESKGTTSAQVVVIEYSDFRCAACKQFAANTVPRIDEEYIRPGKVLWIFRGMPKSLGLGSMGLRTTEAAACAGQQGLFWPMYRALFSRPAIPPDDAAADPELHQLAIAAGADESQFSKCLGAGSTSRVFADVGSGYLLDVTATPTLFLGLRTETGRATIVKRIVGAIPATELGGELDILLRQVG